MKTIRLFSTLLLATLMVGSASAQHYGNRHSRSKPNVYIVAAEQSSNDGEQTDWVIEEFEATRRDGFQQMHNPQFIFSTRNKRFMLGIGGEINFRTSYDFKGATYYIVPTVLITYIFLCF